MRKQVLVEMSQNVAHLSYDSDVNVLTVCRMNQARSPFAQAVISKFFPHIEVASAGVEAIDGIPYLREVVSIARRWGIEISTGASRSINSIPEFQLAELIICAEKWISAEVNLRSPAGQVISYESVVPDSSFMPVDPERMRGRYLETELAKVSWINTRAVFNFLNMRTESQITAVIPDTESDIEAAIEWAATEQLDSNAVIIDADLRSPHAREFRTRGLKVGGFFNLDNKEDFDVFSSIVEQSEPERKLLSEEWRTRIQLIGAGRPILLMTSPQRTQGGPLPDSYLAAITAGKIEVIRRNGNG